MTIKNLSLRNLAITSFVSWIIIFILFFVNIENFSDCINLFLPPAEFDIDMAIFDNSPIVLDIKNENNDVMTEADKLQKIIAENFSDFPMGHDPQARRMFEYINKYKQINRYNFVFTPDEIHDIGLSYKTKFTLDGTEVFNDDTHKYALCIKDDIVFLTKFSSDAEIPTSGESITGVFIPSDKQTIGDLKKVFAEYENINNYYPYEFDTTMLFKSEQRKNLIFLLISIVITGYLIFFVTRQYLFPKKRPLYKKIDMLNGDENIIDEQLKAAVKNGNQYIAKDWVITKSFFRATITRNFL